MNTLTKDPARTLEMTRTFRASKSLLLQLLTQPEHLTHWWGPFGFRTVTSSLDFRPGGKWTFTMIAPDGTEFPNEMEYIECGPDRVSWKSTLPEPTCHFFTTLDLREVPEGTELTFCMHYPDAERRNASAAQGAEGGLGETLTRLDAAVCEEASKADPFRLHVGRLNATSYQLIRSFKAPRNLVWEAFTRPEHLSRWWGPYGHDVKLCEMEAREGGTWRMVMAHDGEDYEFRGDILAFHPEDHLKQTFEWMGMPGHVSVQDVRFEDQGAVTRMVAVCSFDTPEDCEGMLMSGMETGASQSYHRLDDILLFESQEADFVLERTFNAPVEAVWQYWTQAEHLARWWGPADFQTEILEANIHPGGTMLYKMVSPEGNSHFGKFHYREMNEPVALTFVSTFADEQGHQIAAPFLDHWPLQVLNKVGMEGQPGKTTLTLRATPLTTDASELAGFRAAQAMMNEGLSATLDRLEACLRERA